jgi:hypothetical protein
LFFDKGSKLAETSESSKGLSDHPYFDLTTIINEMLPSYLAPAYHYNNYIDAIMTDITWDDIKYDTQEEEWISNIRRRANFQIEIQALLLSIKTGLDRLVSIFSYYYRGFSLDTTFGRIKDNDKPQGFMSTVVENEENDELLKFIKSEYLKWIKLAVQPRDIITHYNDLGLIFEFKPDLLLTTPIHFSERLVKTKETKNMDVSRFTYEDILFFSTNWYYFFDKVMNELLKRELVITSVRI